MNILLVAERHKRKDMNSYNSFNVVYSKLQETIYPFNILKK